MGSVDHLPPIISNYSRAGAAGQVTVAQVEAIDIVAILCFSQFNQRNEIIGGRIGPGNCNLNFVNFMNGATEIPTFISAIWLPIGSPWLISQPSDLLFDALSIVPICRPRQAPGLEDVG